MHVQVHSHIKWTEKDMYIILDLNGVLLKTWQHDPYLPDVKRCHSGGKYVQFRHGWLSFLKKAMSLFRVGIWSTMTFKNVMKVYILMEEEAREKLPFFMVWSQENCLQVENLMRPDKRNVAACFKPLWYVWRYYYPTLDSSNTLLVDNSPYKACMNKQGNCLFPNSFEGWIGGMEDHYLEDVLWPFLERTKVSCNLQDYVEKNRIGQGPINKEHYLYGYLKEVIEAPWDVHIPPTPERKPSMDELMQQQQQKDKRFQSIYEELDAEEIAILDAYENKIQDAKLSRGQTMALAVHLGLKTGTFTMHEAKTHLKKLLLRLKSERHVLNG